MDTIKIKTYEQVHGPGTFVSFRTLSKAEADDVLKRIKHKLSLPEHLEAVRVLQFIRDTSHPVHGVDATRDNFDPKELFRQLSLPRSGNVLLNWYRFDRIDEIRAEDLYLFFGDIWYPFSDDLDIVDPSLNWIVSIDHSGSVRAFRIAAVS